MDVYKSFQHIKGFFLHFKRFMGLRTKYFTFDKTFLSIVHAKAFPETIINENMVFFMVSKVTFYYNGYVN